MDYQNSSDILPKELVEQLQKYAEGKIIYIPKKQKNKKHWGENTDTKQILASRNCQICSDRRNGMTIKQLSEKFFLAEKSIQRILRQEKM